MDQNSFEVRNLNAKTSFEVNRLLRWLLMLALLVAAGGIGFFLFSRSAFSPNNVDFKINAPEDISSGEKITYIVEYQNRNERAIKDLQLTFFYPSDAVRIRENKLAVLQTENLKLDDLGPGEKKTAELPAYLVGSRGDIKKARAVLSFYGEGIPSVFKKEAASATNISSLAVSLTLVAPPNAVSGQEAVYLLDYRNESSADLADLRFKFNYPNGFTPGKFLPDTFASKNVLELKKLKSGEGGRLVVSGILRGTEGESKIISVVLQRKLEDIYIDFEKSSANTVLATPPLTVQISANEQKNYNAQLGDELEYQIKFSNNTEVDFFGLTVLVKLEGTMFDLTSVRGDGFFNSSARTITWNASVSPLLNHLSSRQEGAVSFRVKIKSGFPSGGGVVNESIVKASARAETPTIPPDFDSPAGGRLTAEAELVTKIVSLPSLGQSVFRNDAVFGGSGPFPPRSGQKTVYTVYWEIINIPNDILKAKMRGTLPVGVEWGNQSRVNGQQPALTFNANSRQVIWPLETVPSGTGGQFPKYQAWFLVFFIPSENNIGQAVKLIKDAFLEGHDGFTGQNILVRVGDVSTDDLTDFAGSGNVVD